MTPAIPEDMEQLVYFREHNFRIVKRSEMLGDITLQSKAICHCRNTRKNNNINNYCTFALSVTC